MRPLTEAEREQLAEWNRTEVDYTKDRPLHHFIEDQVTRTPGAVAVVLEDRQLTYRQLNAKANQLARHLQKLGVQPDTLVGICVERSLEMVIGLLAILKAGGAYVPLDPEYPPERLAFMIEDAAVPVLLTQASLVETTPPSAAKLIRLDVDWPLIAAESDAPVESTVTGEDLAYMIYTSGSTGRPKGAMNTHQGIVNRLLWMQDTYRLTPEDSVLQKTPFSFDVSVWEFFWPLMTGARLVVAKPGGHRDGAYLARLIEKEKITTLHFVPSMLQAFLEEEGLGVSCSSLKRVICSGEALPMALQRRFFSMLGAELHNLYGPTEAAVDVTYWACERNSSSSHVPIGRPIANIQLYILDEKLQPVPVGVPGELHLGGIGLARGYHNRPELTAEKFIANPFSKDPKARLYKTGDSTRFLPDGIVEYLGRLDHQVKIRGFRVELGEIENVLNQHPGITASVLVAREDTPGDQRLVAYLVNRNGDVSPSELREYLLAKLPDYMVPAAFVSMKTLPLTPNGKVDRKALPKPGIEAVTDKGTFVAPGSPVEIALSGIWREVLGLTRVGSNDNFFDLGGHSLSAVRLINKINHAFDFHLSIPALFQNPTIRQLAVLVDQATRSQREADLVYRKDAAPGVVTFQEGGSRPPLFFLHGDWAGGGLYCARLAQHLGEDQPFYALPPFRLGEERIVTLEEMVQHHLTALREHTPHGPYFLGGYCIGATIAVEMARQLVDGGEEVLHLFLLDPPPIYHPVLHSVWNLIDKGTNHLEWSLLRKVHFFDRYPVSFSRWLNKPPHKMMDAIGRRLGLTTSSDYSPITLGLEPGEYDEEILESLDYALYFLASCLYPIHPTTLPATVYLPEESSPKWSSMVGNVGRNFPKANIEMVPGNHHTCMTKYASALADRMEKMLGDFSAPVARAGTLTT